MNRQQKRAFRQFVAVWVARLERSMKIGNRKPGNYTVTVAARAAGGTP